jgi:hypothetical protein
MHCVSLKYSICSRIDRVDKLCLQSGVHGTRRGAMRCVRDGQVQGKYWHRRLHRLRRGHVLRGLRGDNAGRVRRVRGRNVLDNYWRDVRKHLSDLPCRNPLARRQRRAGRLCCTRMCSWLHGTRRRSVRGVRGGEVQVSRRQRRVHGLRCRPVLGGDGRNGNRHLSELPRQLTVYDGQRRGD